MCILLHIKYIHTWMYVLLTYAFLYIISTYIYIYTLHIHIKLYIYIYTCNTPWNSTGTSEGLIFKSYNANLPTVFWDWASIESEPPSKIWTRVDFQIRGLGVRSGTLKKLGRFWVYTGLASEMLGRFDFTVYVCFFLMLSCFCVCCMFKTMTSVIPGVRQSFRIWNSLCRKLKL